MDRLPPALPVPLSPLIGRERECADLVASLLDGRTRLLTVTGPGDVGKTRLALAVAQSLESIGADGARFVPLAGMLTAQDVLPAIARAVGVEETGDRPLFAEIVVRLGNSDALLVIDNAEHVADAAPELARLLAACPALRMLVTSRVAMRIQGEREFSLLPFALPGPDATAAALTGSDAVALFLESSREDRSRLVRSDADLVAIGGICRRLDGLPLAIELAAARSTVLSPRGMLARLERRLPLLTGGGRDLPERQRTLRATIRWSYDLLTPTQQRLFRQISVFSSATLEAIEGDQMGIADPIPGDASPIFDDLAALVDHSLLRRSEDPDREPRYFMLETIREFGHEMLAELDELASAKERHASFFAKFAESGASALTGPEQAHWLRRFERDQDNLRVALRWAIEERATRTAARIGSSLGRWWLLRGHLTEGRRWIGEVLALDPDAVTAERATTLTVMGALAEDQGDHTAAIAAHGESLAIAEALSDDYGIARATNNIGLVRLGQGDYAAATRQFEASLLAFRSLGNDAAGAVTMLNLATVADRAGDEETASRLLEAALTVQRAAGDAQRIAWTLQTLGLVATGRGELDQADAAFVEAIALWEELGDAQSVARTLAHRGRLARLRGEKERAAELLAEGLARAAAEEDDQLSAALCCLDLMVIAWQRNEFDVAARLLGAAEARHDWRSAPLRPDERSDYDRAERSLRAKFPSPSFAPLHADGRAAPLGWAVEQAVRFQTAPKRPPEKGPPAAGIAFHLTPREIDVLRHLVQGKTDREIGDDLFISHRTVMRHMTGILDKLAAPTRTAAAAIAVRRGFV